MICFHQALPFKTENTIRIHENIKIQYIYLSNLV